MKSLIEKHKSEIKKSRTVSEKQQSILKLLIPQTYSKAQAEKYQRSMHKEISRLDLAQTIQLQELQTLLQEANQMKEGQESLKLQKIYNKFRTLRWVSFLCLFVMSFFETPQWCNKVDYTDNCSILNSNRNIMIPTSRLPYMNKYIFLISQTLILTFLTINKEIKFRYLKSNPREKIYIQILTGLTILSLIDNLAEIIYDQEYNLNLTMFYIPIYFILYHQKLRKMFKLYWNIIKSGYPLLFALFFNIIIFAGLGRFLFTEVTEQDGNYFFSFCDACFELLVLQTTSNYPDVMMPFYKIHPWAPIFFMTFLILNFLIIQNMLLAVFYTQFQSELKNDTRDFFINKNQVENALKMLYKNKQMQRKKSTSSNNNDIGISSPRSQEQDYVKFEDEDEQYDIQKEIIRSMSGKEDKQLSAKELIEIVNHQSDKNNSEFSKAHLYQLQNLYLNEEENQRKSLKYYMALILANFYWDQFIGLICLCNFLLIYFEVPSNLAKQAQSEVLNQNQVTREINMYVSIFLFIEGYGRLILVGVENFIEHTFWVFEFVLGNITVLAFIAYFEFYTSQQQYWLGAFCQLCILLKLLRFPRSMSRIPSIEVIYASLKNFLTQFYELFGVLLMLFFLYAALGQHIFGGQYNTSQQSKINPTSYGGYEVPDYVYNNFNDIGNSFVLLFELLVVNNWPVNTEVACSIMGSKLYRLFFIIWYVIAVLLSLNIVIAFIIDQFVKNWEKYTNWQEMKQRLNEENTTTTDQNQDEIDSGSDQEDNKESNRSKNQNKEQTIEDKLKQQEKLQRQMDQLQKEIQILQKENQKENNKEIIIEMSKRKNQ